MKKYYFALVLTLFILPIFSQNIPSYVPKDGLVGYWPFNGNANDESGNGNHGTVNGATLTSDRNGVANSAYSFDGTSNYINSNVKNINGTSFSLSVWFWVDDKGFMGGNHRTLFGSRTSGSDFLGVGFHNDGFHNEPFIYFDLPTTQRCKIEYNLPTDKIWHNIIVTLDENNQTIYIDGKKVNKRLLKYSGSILS
jgi:hypothetical protein